LKTSNWPGKRQKVLWRTCVNFVTVARGGKPAQEVEDCERETMHQCIPSSYTLIKNRSIFLAFNFFNNLMFIPQVLGKSSTVELYLENFEPDCKFQERHHAEPVADYYELSFRHISQN